MRAWLRLGRRLAAALRQPARERELATRVEFWDVAGQPLKRITAGEIKALANHHFQPMHSVAENLQTGHRTTIHFDSFEVDQNVNGQKWRVALKRNGHRFFRGVRTTHAPSGSFDVERSVKNGPGPDRIKARARNLQTGEVCKGALTI